MTEPLVYRGDARAGAVFSVDMRFRYELHRVWDPAGAKCLFVMLNPSTATESEDDPTIRRCIGFAKAWGYGGVRIGNLFALRSTDPRALYPEPDPVGPMNDRVLTDLHLSSGLTVCAWGAHGKLRGRAVDVLALLAGKPVHALRVTAGGQPSHPLYLPGHLQPVPFPGTVSA